jgi:hypothetical protein
MTVSTFATDCGPVSAAGPRIQTVWGWGGP